MADGDTVTMQLTFWRDDKKPGDTVEVPADEVHRWKGFAVQVDEPAPAQPADPKPDAAAKVDEWRTYAMKLGLDQARADKATKQELQDYVRDASDKA